MLRLAMVLGWVWLIFGLRLARFELFVIVLGLRPIGFLGLTLWVL